MRVMLLLFAALAACAAELQLPFRLVELKAFSISTANARQQLEQIVERAAATGDVVSEAYARVALAALDENDQQPDRAEKRLRDAATERVIQLEPAFVPFSELWLADECRRLRRVVRSHFWAGKAADDFRIRGDFGNFARALHLRTRLMAPSLKRTSTLREAFASASRTGDRFLTAPIEADLGDALRVEGDLANALTYLTHSTSVLNESARHDPDLRPAEARALFQLGRALTAHGREDEALQRLAQAEKLLPPGNDRELALNIGIESARILASIGRREEAVRIVSGLKMEGAGAREALTRTSFAALTYVYFALGDYRKALNLAEPLLKEYPGVSFPAVQWIAGACYFQLGRYHEAVAVTSDAIKLSSQPKSLPMLSALRWRARALDRLGRFDEAGRDMIEAARLARNVLDRLAPNDEWKRGFLEGRQQVADDIISVLWRAGKQTEALQAAEDFRARAFLDLMASRDNAGQSSPTLTSNGVSESIPLERVSAEAKASRATVLAYYVHPDGLYVWLVASDGSTHAAHRPVPSGELQALVGRARSLGYQPDRAAWRELHKLLIEPVKTWLPAPGNELLTVLPHGPLLHLPFGALLNAKGRYLLQDFAIRILPATAFLFRAGQGAKSPLVLIGAPADPPTAAGGKPMPQLPGAARELNQIAAIAPAESQLFSGHAAAAPAVREAVPRASVLHFATHAVIDARRPFDSFLALSDRGKLTAREVYQFRLATDLVTLSACRAASGRISYDGLLGFTRAFLFAGAASVVAPLWDIPDQPTVRIMEQFYRSYLGGARKSVALRQAQLSLLRDLRAGQVTVVTPAGPMALPEHPAIWAGFVLQGAD